MKSYQKAAQILDKPIKIRKLIPSAYGSVIKEPDVNGDDPNRRPYFYRLGFSGEWEDLSGAGQVTPLGIAFIIYRNVWEVSSMTEFEELLVTHPDWYPDASDVHIEHARQRK